MPRPFAVNRSVLCTPGHGRELMGLKSPISVPVLGVNLTQITSRRQGSYREVGSEGSHRASALGEALSARKQ